MIGHFLIPKLLEAHTSINCISRGPIPDKFKTLIGLHWYEADITVDKLPDIAAKTEYLVHLAPIWLLPPLLYDLPQGCLKRIIAFSSTSRLSKQNSPNNYEKCTAEKLARAENLVYSIASKKGICWTIFRPTLIYGAGLDKNISSIARFIDRFGFFPLPKKAAGLRQPVHADDLSRVCMDIIQRGNNNNQIYNLPGGETLPYREMVSRIFSALGKTERIIPVPSWLLRTGLWAASLIPGFSHLTPEMANRTNQDLVFSMQQAGLDLGYTPRGFSPSGKDLL